MDDQRDPEPVQLIWPESKLQYYPRLHTVLMAKAASSILRLIDEPLEKHLQEVLDEWGSWQPSSPLASLGSFFLHGYLFATSIEGLSIPAKLSILCALEEALCGLDDCSFALEELCFDRLISGGDYGIDIDDVLAIGNGWKIRVKADGGSGSVLAGEALDDPLTITIGDLCRAARSQLSDWEAIDWSEVCKQDLDIKDGSTAVFADEGMDGFGQPQFTLISPDGRELQLDDDSLSVTMDDGQFSGRGSVLVKHAHDGETLEFNVEYDLSECESVCLGHNIDWEVCKTSFGAALDAALLRGLSFLKQALD
jgi:hypothetical protein